MLIIADQNLSAATSLRQLSKLKDGMTLLKILENYSIFCFPAYQAAVKMQFFHGETSMTEAVRLLKDLVLEEVGFDRGSAGFITKSARLGYDHTHCSVCRRVQKYHDLTGSDQSPVCSILLGAFQEALAAARNRFFDHEQPSIFLPAAETLQTWLSHQDRLNDALRTKVHFPLEWFIP